MKKTVFLFSVIIIVAGCVSQNNNYESIRLKTCQLVSEDKSISEFYKWSSNLPRESKIITWWDFGQCIKSATGLTSILEHPSKDIQKYTINYNGPFENHEKIRDISIALFTDNKNESLCKLKKYESTHLILTEDMIGKSSIISSIFTETNNFSAQDYMKFKIEKEQSDYIINVGLNNFFIIEKDSLKTAFNQKGNEYQLKYVIFNNTLYTNSRGVDGVVMWISEDFMNAVTMPEGLKNSAFTDLYFLNSTKFNNFKKLFDFGGLKVFLIDYPSNLAC